MSLMKKKNPRLANNIAAAARTEKDELLSRLPEELIHRILGFLTTKDAIKASFVSKYLQASWLSSSPSLHFRQQDFSCLHEYVFTTMERVSNHKINLHSFKFQTFKFSDTKTLDKWIGFALGGRVREISLDLGGVKHCLPERVLTSSSFLKSLDLVYGRLQLSLLGDDDVIVINLPCLQSLTLNRVSIDEDTLERLLKGCPLLEHLKITPIAELLSQLNISHLKLKSLHVTNNDCYRSKTLDKVEVDAPCLEKFSYTNTCSLFEDRADIILKSSTSKNLKYIFLYLFTRSSKELWLSKLLPNFTSLETLELCLSYDDVKTIKISNPHIKNISVTLTNVAEIEIDCPMLLSLRCMAHNVILAPSLLALMVNGHQPNNYVGHLHIHECSHADLNTAWFHKLRELLSTSWIPAMSLLCLLPSREDIENGDNESLPTSAGKIEQLYLIVKGPKSCYSFIMNGFLSACQPDTIYLASLPSAEEDGTESIHFIEFFREKLENWKDGDGCYCSDKIKCWKHQLKSVEIQEFRKFEDELERNHYDFSILPEPPSFRLKFQWF